MACFGGHWSVEEVREKSLERETSHQGVWVVQNNLEVGGESHRRGTMEDVKLAFERARSNSCCVGGTVEPGVALRAQRHTAWHLLE